MYAQFGNVARDNSWEINAINKNDGARKYIKVESMFRAVGFV
jgi:hypothetical protein